MGKRFEQTLYQMYQWPISTLEGGLTSLVIREIKIKAMRYHYIPMRMSKIKQTDSTKCWGRDVEELELIHGWWECKMA